MKHRVLYVLLIAVIAAVATGWRVDRRRLAERLEEEVEREGAISSSLSAAMFSNLIYTQLDTLSPEEFAARRESQLLTNTLFLWAHRDNAVDRTLVEQEGYKVRVEQRKGLISTAGRSLELLDVATVDDFASKLASARLTKEFKAPALDADGDPTSELVGSIQLCLDHHNYQSLIAKYDLSFDETVELVECTVRLYEAGEVGMSELLRAQDSLESPPRELSEEEQSLLDRVREMLGQPIVAPADL
ncbi:hypothetical protein KOR34_50390 [Posidoniimonas corsicana]|uniref:Uncharacterized protein n=1 Tax=Posidoniimonas corsicana TaxID=1938618 RepID=A0A5C5UXV5_9BACT|nr:hypothetical protein [Posidoniimonas corsicana]TWT30480.1 hypothetical protein KOR34_50390 [Posidoniimonas corsicana]